MRIEIGDKYVIEGSTNDLILYVKNIVQHGKTAGQITESRIGYYSKVEHLIRALINHDIRTGEASTLQDIQSQITRIAEWCELAFKAEEAEV
ncbi:replication initiation protein [Pantoea phage PA-1]